MWLRPVAVVGATAMTLFLGPYLLDYLLGGEHLERGLLDMLFHYDPETVQNALGNLSQVVVAVLGIVITVVSIVVQLAANRYTPRIADMFFRDRNNLTVLGFFVTTCISSLWVSLSVGREFVPVLSIAITLALVTFSLLLMIPYFAYVFNFLDPEHIIGRIQQLSLDAALRSGVDLGKRQLAALCGLEQLCDVAVNAVSNKDKMIAASAVNAIKDLGTSYLRQKAEQPAAWFALGEALRTNPDFVGLAPESVEDLARRRTWLEWKLLRQFQAIYSEALREAPDINYLLAIDTRYLGEAALAAGDREALSLTVKFFNTFLRLTLNAQNVRTAYNLLHQYRLLAERVLAAGEAAMVADIGSYLRYYAQVAQGMHLGFVAESIAYDLALLCEQAHERRSPAHDALLQALLSVDQAADDEAQEKTLRGVRKAQLKLACAYLVRGDEAAARLIYEDMRDERPERLRSLRAEMLSVGARDFWEIIDRGTNFDYMDPMRKEQLQVFFSWFPGLA